MASEGTLGLIDTIAPGLSPGSDVANLAVLGYDPRFCYTGRGPLEAANMGITLAPEDIAFRCNLVTLSDDADPVMEDFTAGHISSEEAERIIIDLDRAIGSETFFFIRASATGICWSGRGERSTLRLRRLMILPGRSPDPIFHRERAPMRSDA